MADIIFPEGNEKEFVDIAERIGIKEIYFIYNFKKNADDLKNKIAELQKTTKIKLKIGIIANQQNVLAAKRICDFVIMESSGNDQHIIEKLSPNLVFNFEKSEKRDKLHYRFSGLNQVLCKAAIRKNIVIGFSFSEILHSEPKRRAILLGRMIQNIKLCRKYKVKTLFASFAKKPFDLRDEKELNSLYSLLYRNI